MINLILIILIICVIIMIILVSRGDSAILDFFSKFDNKKVDTPNFYSSRSPSPQISPVRSPILATSGVKTPKRDYSCFYNTPSASQNRSFYAKPTPRRYASKDVFCDPSYYPSPFFQKHQKTPYPQSILKKTPKKSMFTLNQDENSFRNDNQIPIFQPSTRKSNSNYYDDF